MSITFIGAGIWMLVAMVVAVRQALDYQSTWRAIGVVVIGFLVQVIFLIMMLRIFGPS
jgi:ACR3 family arsenite efflux pump ArsB